MPEKDLKKAKFIEPVTYTFKTIEKIQETIKRNFQEATIFTLLKDKATFGKYTNQQIELPDNENIAFYKIEEMRIFDPTKELYIWRQNDTLKGRLREDLPETGTKDIEYIISDLVLWGTRAKTEKPGWTTLKEDRGIEYTVPFPVKRVDEKHPLCLTIHTYIGYINDIQASYIDSRFVGFTEGGE
ncbi:MAG: CRISPR-associated protein Csx19 [Thermotogota bacterium]|nr:CRISPR-associated protein Csx19 [Thermotogota bacterium]